MKSKAVVLCTFAGTILAASVGTANSSSLHVGARSHHWHGQRVAHRQPERTVTAKSRHAEGLAAVAGSAAGGLMSGIASIYSGERTANGEFASAKGLTAAHRTLPFGTMVKVTNQSTGRSVVVRINDRGPFVRGRVIDMTPAGAHAIGVDGLAPVTLAVVGHS
jgi:rare lipoprotein A